MFLSWARGVCGACGGLHMLIQDKVASIACQVVVAGRLRVGGTPVGRPVAVQAVLPCARDRLSSPVNHPFRFSTQKAAVAASCLRADAGGVQPSPLSVAYRRSSRSGVSERCLPVSVSLRPPPAAVVPDNSLPFVLADVVPAAVTSPPSLPGTSASPCGICCRAL